MKKPPLPPKPSLVRLLAGVAGGTFGTSLVYEALTRGDLAVLPLGVALLALGVLLAGVPVARAFLVLAWAREQTTAHPKDGEQKKA